MTNPIGIPPRHILDQALCTNPYYHPDTWYPDKGYSSNYAKAICQECPARAACLQWALNNHEPHGIWGGLNPDERRKLLNRKAAS